MYVRAPRGICVNSVAPGPIEAGMLLSGPAHSEEWLAANVPGASPRLMPAEGHISIIESRFGDVLDDLVALAR